jgi:hypothetical protein
MRGFPTACCICGAPGEVFGCPSYFDACIDKEACRQRVLEQSEARENRLKEQEKKIKALEHDLALLQLEG